MENFEIGFSGGAAIPLGNFRSVNIENSLDRSSLDQDSERFRGFPKDKGGQAIFGYAFGSHLRYKINSSFFVSLNFLRTNNSIDISPQQRFYDDNFRYQIDFEGNESEILGMLMSDDYRADLFFLSLGYTFKVKIFDLSFSGLIGQNSLHFPFYSWNYQFSETGSILFRPADFAEIPKPTKLNNLLYGLEVKASYPLVNKINSFVLLSYLRSDHPHEYWTLARGASYAYFIEDRIDFRIFLASVGVSLSL
ncbi:hypothetical protein A33Q_2894 [Indibacter alkaliphilus LW1]|uniref:Outer membrane protein beta-barrel domain-containing protein n=1 Tax=Indibacter alkaliphilus (strain CCUG 57479 / KCTC 22604 / LW1) TaxID=1189612 RepID=S2D8K0_INDAL|nr:hypothetical protein [Indibacter alkaliphilus]EOZ95532.1 hypothetical protein A33Q_2894 [Indibacter alkaliphilus LW1]